MKRISININYYTQYGESLVLMEGKHNCDRWEEKRLLTMNYSSSSRWCTSFDIPKNQEEIKFKILVKRGDTILREEDGNPHHFTGLPSGDCFIECQWQDKHRQEYFNTSFFYNSVFKHSYKKLHKKTFNIRLLVDCVHVEPSQELVICGGGALLGDWKIEKAITLIPVEYRKWALNLSSEESEQIGLFKYAIRDKDSKEAIEWEEGENRSINQIRRQEDSYILEQSYRKKKINWRASGVAIPVFSLRSEQSMGIGDFSDLRFMIDWAAQTGMKVIQTLPINDTTATHTWIDSYPYNAISVYALHPIYLGMNGYKLKNKEKQTTYIREGKKLNQLSAIDYNNVFKLKTDFQKDLFHDIGEDIISSEEFKSFFKLNKEWLFPYACFCYLRDKYQTSKLSDWEEYRIYNKQQLENLFASDIEIQSIINQVYFVQYLLHKQLTEIKGYAHSKGVVLKGDIPIGISPNSVEAWTEPDLFNMDCQTGAPPDDFSLEGQNWGFPTYKWSEMAKDEYGWWRKRFVKMSDYFDAYRIDHILGFFRIWEIPQTAVNGLLGYFSPALPLSATEINDWGFSFDEQNDTTASIHKDSLKQVFGEYSEEAVNKYLSWVGSDLFILNKQVDTQRKIQNIFNKLPDNDKNKLLYKGLMQVSSEVLFVKDKYDSTKFHPRISLQRTLRYNKLTKEQINSINLLYDDYFYHRHTIFWRQEAMSKLPALIKSTNMLVCGEDLGMVPDSVHSVMDELEILSLEIQRMPKQSGVTFSILDQIPYLSVATTSTHDMSPIRMWWKENEKATQEYFETRLHLEGKAPEECNTIISSEILRSHLHSPAMLTIFPLQDWLSVSDKLRRTNPNEERINIPSDPKHNWNYRMHLSLEDLLKNNEFSDLIKFMNTESGR